MGKKMSFQQLVTGKPGASQVHIDAKIIKAHTDSYDIKTSNGEVKKYVSNTTDGSFANNDSVIVLFDESTDDYRIIGRGRRLSDVSGIKKVEV